MSINFSAPEIRKARAKAFALLIKWQQEKRRIEEEACTKSKDELQCVAVVTVSGEELHRDSSSIRTDI